MTWCIDWTVLGCAAGFRQHRGLYSRRSNEQNQHPVVMEWSRHRQRSSAWCKPVSCRHHFAFATNTCLRSISKPPLAGSPSEHCHNVWYRKTRMVGMDTWRIELCRRQWLWSTVNVGRSNEGWHCKWSWVTFEGHCKRFRCLSFKNTVYIISKVNYNWWTSLYEQLFLYCSIRSEKLLYDVERPVSDS